MSKYIVTLKRIFPISNYYLLSRRSFSFRVLIVFIVALFGGGRVLRSEGNDKVAVFHDAPDRVRKIEIDVSSPYSQSGGNDIEIIQSYLSGASWEAPIPSYTWDKLKAIGVKSVRLINVENPNAISIDASGSVSGINFESLGLSLADCRRYDLNPHIVVGQRLQKSTAFRTPDGLLYGISNADAYGKYAYSLIKFVAVDRGFNRAIFEVSNEPDTNGAPWLMAGKQSAGSELMYRAYFELYEIWARAAEKFRLDFPDTHIKIGGPAITPYTLVRDRLDWAGAFVGDVASKKIPLDFFSFHVYGDQDALSGSLKFGPYPSFAERVSHYRKILKRNGLEHVPLAVTEWGPSASTDETAHGIVNGNEIGAAWSARFVQDMLDNRISSAMLLILRDHEFKGGGGDNWGWPAFLLADGVTPKPVYNFALMLKRMAPVRVEVVGSDNVVPVLASKDNSKITAILANGDWSDSLSKDRASVQTMSIVLENIPFKARRIKIERYLIDGRHSNAFFSRKNFGRVGPGTGELERIDESVVPISGGSAVLPSVAVLPSAVFFYEMTPIN
ncbi:GH39 family glycosyl hydrolase [Burkholderia sp. Bp8998]|uniref:GH39 family glycosyl hydrolase n=1 Tax=Burkholderia sp. Bp8998 TaxID=2184557 RepID=UPI000F59A5F4|nr:hypothetical protein [Burkholderia sp. Bp8998]RQS08863.1 hypothetical protein DIE06_32390 [Burkholderia sp. Bp8998]